MAEKYTILEDAKNTRLPYTLFFDGVVVGQYETKIDAENRQIELEMLDDEPIKKPEKLKNQEKSTASGSKQGVPEVTASGSNQGKDSKQGVPEVTAKDAKQDKNLTADKQVKNLVEASKETVKLSVPDATAKVSTLQIFRLRKQFQGDVYYKYGKWYSKHSFVVSEIEQLKKDYETSGFDASSYILEIESSYVTIIP